MSNNPRRRSTELVSSNLNVSARPDIPVSRSLKGLMLNHRLPTNALIGSLHSFSQDATQTRVNDHKACEDCEQFVTHIWNCSYCGMDFCDPCWLRQAQHKPGRVGPDGLPHEKANPSIVRRFKDILTPPRERQAQEILHREDEDTTCNTGEHEARFPQLVSFIRQTGAGKSTLIRMLIEQQQDNSSDPSTCTSEYPILLADCEGLEGGENIPISEQMREKYLATGEKKSKEKASKTQRLTKRLTSTRHELKWAISPAQKKRQYSVTELYPRLLYTFSDVIVFVLRNAITFESTVLSTIINWARSSIEKSLNQPTLPHVVIALNVSDTKIDEKSWDPDYATHALMSDVAGAIERDPTYKDLKTFWVEKGKKINTMQDLLLCYYSSITVVRIPGEGRYMMINSQVQTLHDAVSRRCKESSNSKRRSRMLSTSDTLNVYLQSAFEHFSTDLDVPFNFMDVSFQINPIPLDFGGNILKLAVAMKRLFTDACRLFQELSFMVASCILLDCVRQNIRGPPQEVFEKHYLLHCDTALENFCASYWPCKYRGKNGEPCVNVPGSHSKGHQNSKGNVMRPGEYMSDFTFEQFGDAWLQYLQLHLTKMQHDLSARLMQPPSLSEVTVVKKLHHTNMELFYKKLDGAQGFISHQTCFSCLRELAEHPLPCGHVLCTPCIKSYGRPHPNLLYSYAMTSCPLHQAHTVFSSHWPIFFKPPLAGVRVLSLDGGGARGAVLLEILTRIQQELGGRIPIQDFFDLIVGTSLSWLMNAAFTKRFPRRIGKSKYQTKPLVTTLTGTFGDDAMFAGSIPDSAPGPARKVAVTAVTETGEKAVIFANYNRKHDSETRATSAAPTYFKPFVNPRTKEVFIDGALYYNNPVRIANYESMLIWPETKGSHPDILLSLGTAYNKANRDEKRKENAYKPYSEPRSWYHLFKRQIKNCLNAELAWTAFRNDVVGTSSPIAAQRYVRINPKLTAPVPKMDAKDNIWILRNHVKNNLTSNEMKGVIEKIAHRLISSSFYFDKTGPLVEHAGSWAYKGIIRCRFAAESENIRYLGEHIKSKFKRRNFQPFFRIHDVADAENAQDIKLNRNVLEDMIEILEFRIEPIVIPVASESALITIDLHLTDDAMKPELRNGFPISGFPRSLCEEELLRKTTSQPATPVLTPHPVATKRQNLQARNSIRRSGDESVKHSNQGSHIRIGQDRSIDETEEDDEKWATRLSNVIRPPNPPHPRSDSGSLASMRGSMNSTNSLQQLDEAVSCFIAGDTEENIE
ncbi:hypothetical protein BU24DRAFT_431280 [Aaosphaeria arxii CBS 175.79]|uniref:FabD/lysophospholipase-like protein n=1 Tax=Aaosphaeria arxii CBS 175.79 TaxID=1450172 RepID=A0A6A5Y2N5_9PLEO|nr:uncharacterized protein BU24DRAFT_431280 [Aaosphaeria arxii CBS 175.79]KAF2019496.1 hypothetical protein BU24DRAFT_431280 [Aaosphaeria arxii CBS 175.79]